MTVAIRALNDADETRWRALWQGYLTFYETEIAPSTTDITWSRLLDASKPDVFGLAAEGEGGGIIGFIHCVLHLNTWTVKPVCYLEDLFVDQASRNMGAGRALIEAVRERGRSDGWHRIYWRTRKNNATARALYDTLAVGTDWVTYEISL